MDTPQALPTPPTPVTSATSSVIPTQTINMANPESWPGRPSHLPDATPLTDDQRLRNIVAQARQKCYGSDRPKTIRIASALPRRLRQLESERNRDGNDTLARRHIEYTGRYDPDPQQLKKPMCIRCQKNPLHDGISGLCLMCLRSDKRKLEMQRMNNSDGRLLTVTQRQAGIPDYYARARLTDLESETQQELLSAPRGWYCFGPVGVGKTHLLAAWANDLLARGHEVVWTGFEAMLGACRASYADGPGGQEMMIGHFCAAQHLCLDELSPAATAWARETFCRILDSRLTHHMPTFIATNLEPEQLDAAFDPRIASRLATLPHLAVHGPDRRRLKDSE